MPSMQRRTFLAATGLTALSASSAVGANDRLNVALIGCGGRGRFVARFIREAPNVSYVAVADVYTRNGESPPERGGPHAKVHPGFRRVLHIKGVAAAPIPAPHHPQA